MSNLICKSCLLELNRIDEDYINNPVYKGAQRVCPNCQDTMEILERKHELNFEI